MRTIAKYLIEHYYKQSPPDEELLAKALDLHQDKVVVVHEGETIRGVAVFLTLTDETYKTIDSQKIQTVDVLSKLLQERGDNLHFILLTARGMSDILCGLRAVKAARHPKTISWWNPGMTHLHKYPQEGVCLN